MNPPSPVAPDAVAEQHPGDIDLEALLGDSDAQLVYEALYRLRELKFEALRFVRAESLSINEREFQPKDFDIPQIDKLLSRFGLPPVRNAVDAAQEP